MRYLRFALVELMPINVLGLSLLLTHLMAPHLMEEYGLSTFVFGGAMIHLPIATIIYILAVNGVDRNLYPGILRPEEFQ